MRKLMYREKLFMSETAQMNNTVKEKRRNRRKNRTLYNIRENYKQPVHYSGSLVCLIHNGFTLQEAQELLKR